MNKISLFMTFLLWAHLSQAIVRGTEVSQNDPIRKTVFMLISSNKAPQNDMADGGLCTASALSRKVLITAAHCVDESWNQSIHFTDQGGSTHTFKIIKIKKHESFIPNLNIYRQQLPLAQQKNRIENLDIALVALETELPEDTIPVLLPRLKEDLDLTSPFTKVHAFGFGRVTGEALRSGKSGLLRHGEIRVQGYDPQRDNFEITQFDESSQGICTGDSGGPSLLKTPQGWMLLGNAYDVTPYIFPGEENPDRCRGLGAYVNVSKYLFWISSNQSRLEGAR